MACSMCVSVMVMVMVVVVALLLLDLMLVPAAILGFHLNRAVVDMEVMRKYVRYFRLNFLTTTHTLIDHHNMYCTGDKP